MFSIPYDPSRQSLYHPELRPTLFSQSAVTTLTAIATEVARLAYMRIEESDVSREQLNKALRLAGFSSATPFMHKESGGAAFGTLHSSGLALLAFRGTQADRLQDMLTNGNIILNRWALGAGSVHAGFAKSALGLWPMIEQWLQNTMAQRTSLLICGHSLGAALATLLTLPCRANHLITLGSPRVGDIEFCSSLVGTTRLSMTRIVNCCDGVTLVPFESMNYQHAGETCYIDRFGSIDTTSNQQAIDDDRVHARAEYLAQHALSPGNVKLRELADHAPINYIRAFWP